MLILPIVNKNRVLNVKIELKAAKKIYSGVNLDDMLESDVVINGNKFSDSTFFNSTSENAELDFIRSSSLLYKRNYRVTTREESDSTQYDVYEVDLPPKKINDGLDNLYGSVITDMRKEIPGVPRGRYVSFEKLGVGRHLTDERIARLQRIVSEVHDTSEWPKLFEEAGIADLVQTLDFVNLFDCTVIGSSSIPEDTLGTIIEAFDKLKTKDSRNLKKYYQTALDNHDIYAKISYINKLVYDRPLNLIQSEGQKSVQFVKKNEIRNNGN